MESKRLRLSRHAPIVNMGHQHDFNTVLVSTSKTKLIMYCFLFFFLWNRIYWVVPGALWRYALVIMSVACTQWAMRSYQSVLIPIENGYQASSVSSQPTCPPCTVVVINDTASVCHKRHKASRHIRAKTESKGHNQHAQSANACSIGYDAALTHARQQRSRHHCIALFGTQSNVAQVDFL